MTPSVGPSFVTRLFLYFMISVGWGRDWDSQTLKQGCVLLESRETKARRQRCLQPIAAKNRAAVTNRRIAPGTGPMPGAHRCCSLSPDSTPHSTGTRELSHSLASVLKC